MAAKAVPTRAGKAVAKKAMAKATAMKAMKAMNFAKTRATKRRRQIDEWQQYCSSCASPRRARGTIWTRISVTPDLEISVRGDLDPIERDIFEQLADQLRAILTGRTKHD